MTERLDDRPFAALWRDLPPARDFFALQGLPMPRPDQTPGDYFAGLSADASATRPSADSA